MSRPLLVMLWQPPLEQTCLFPLEQKLSLLIGVLNRAYEIFTAHLKTVSQAEPHPTLLFVAPEHYFVGKHQNAYRRAQKQHIQAILALWSKDKEHCILLPGTIKWRQVALPNSIEQQDAIDAFRQIGFQYYKNLKRDPLQEPSWFYTLDNRTDRNFIFNTSSVFHHGKIYEYSKQTDCKDLNESEHQRATFRFGSQSPMIEIDGLRLGLEICADHDHCLLRKKIDESHQLIDIHIVQSNGLSNLIDAIACHHHGVYVHCDSNAFTNSLVLSFQDGKGQEHHCLNTEPENGLIWWQTHTKSITLCNEETDKLTSAFSAIDIVSLRPAVNVSENKQIINPVKRTM
ncbi:hypothetical protein [Candidatus Berkiella aquae]|nr:hypothetical protein [Candidatus Berkiella aquae]MCS5709821.1 hypothetical protein [Candidatus Berkiella aquae]